MGGVALDVDTGGVKAPDGGWGWAVLAGCFVITGFSYAFPKAVSVFFKELIREFGVGYSDTAWISSILLAMLYGTGRLLLVQNIKHYKHGASEFTYWFHATCNKQFHRQHGHLKNKTNTDNCVYLFAIFNCLYIILRIF